MDLEFRTRWVEYSRAKDEMISYTDIKQAPWFMVNEDIIWVPDVYPQSEQIKKKT